MKEESDKKKTTIEAKKEDVKPDNKLDTKAESLQTA